MRRPASSTTSCRWRSPPVRSVTATPRRSPKAWSSWPTSTPRWWPSPPPCPTPPGCLPFRQRFPDRCFDVGIAEQHAVTAAAGMAMGGLRPVVAVYSTFLTRAFDQTNLDVGLHGLPVILCLDRAGITGPDGPSHYGILDLVLLSKVPGMTIFCPSSYQELQQMLQDAYELERTGGDPVASDGGAERAPRSTSASGWPLVRFGREPSVCLDRGRQDARRRHRSRRAAAGVGRRRNGVGPEGGQAARPGACSPTQPSTTSWSRSKTVWPKAASDRTSLASSPPATPPS